MKVRRALHKSIGIAAILATSALSLSGCAVERQRIVEERRTMAFDLYGEGEKLENAGDYSNALKKYLAALELNERPAFLYKAGRMHHLLGNPERAIIFYDRALEAQPSFELASTHRELARLELVEAGIPTPAKINSTTEIAAAPSPTPAPTPEASPAPAVTEPRQERETRANNLNIAQQPATPTPAPPSTPVSRPTPTPVAEPQPTPTVVAAPTLEPRSAGTVFERLDQDEVRAALFPELYSDADPGQARRAAKEASDSGRWAEAVLGWNRVLEKNPEDIEARLALAKAYRETERGRRAMQEYETAAAMAPNDPEVYFQWGNASVEAGEPANAEKHYQQALKLLPTYAKARNNLAALYMELGRYEQAIPELRRLLADTQDFAPAHLNLARSLDASGGDIAEAIAHVETYLRLGGDGQEQAEQYLVHLRARLATNS